MSLIYRLQVLLWGSIWDIWCLLVCITEHKNYCIGKAKGIGLYSTLYLIEFKKELNEVSAEL